MSEPQELTVQDVAIAEARQNEEIARVRGQVALTMASPAHFDRLGDEPYLNARGCALFSSIFGISTRILQAEREILKDEQGEYHLYEYRVEASVLHPKTGEKVVAERTGTSSTRDPFFSKRSGQFLPISEVNVGDVRKKAETNACGRAIKALLGFYPTWEELQGAWGSQADQVRQVKYRTDPMETAAKKSYELTDAHRELSQLCWEMAEQFVTPTLSRGEAAANFLENYTSFTVAKGADKGKEVSGVRSVKDRLSATRAKIALGKARKDYAQFLKEKGELPVAKKEEGDPF